VVPTVVEGVPAVVVVALVELEAPAAPVVLEEVGPVVLVTVPVVVLSLELLVPEAPTVLETPEPLEPLP
jgi:hypothetical protein